MSEQTVINIEVTYALPDTQKVIPVKLTEGSSAHDAIEKSSILNIFPAIDLTSNKVGVFGKAVKLPKKHILHDGDRVEIYRPLTNTKKPKKAQKIEYNNQC